MARTTGVSNPVRSPGFRASASVAGQEVAFAIGVLPDIYAFHCYTGNSTSLSRTLSPTVSVALLRLSRRFSRPTCGTAYTPFTPSKSGQRLPPLSYRGCWHRVSRGFLWEYRQPGAVLMRRTSSLLTVVYDPKAFIPHAVSLGQAFAHCPIFLTGGSRRSLGLVSVPMRLVILSDQLPVIALVSRDLTN